MPKAFGRVQSRVENEETEVVSRPEEREMERVKEEERGPRECIAKYRVIMRVEMGVGKLLSWEKFGS